MSVVTRENFGRLLTDIEQGAIAPIYLLFGESYLVGSALTELIERLIPEPQRGTNLQVVDGAQADFGAILDSLNTFALFAGRKVAIVRSARIFSSRADLPGLFARSRAAHETGALDAAARTLLEALAYAGWALEDLTSEGWREIPAHLWQKTFGVDRHDPDMVWIDAVLAHAVEKGMTARERRDEAALLEAALRRGFPPNHCLIVTAETVDKRRSLCRLIEERGVVVDFTVAAGTGREARSQQDALLRGIIRQMLTDAGKTMEPEAIRLLMERVGFNLWALNNQLQQLIVFLGPEPAILREHVEALSHHVREEALYELTGAVTAGNCAMALALLRRLLDQGYHALQVLAALGNEIRRLIAARDFIDAHLGGRLDPAMPYGAFHKTVHPLMKSHLPAGSPLVSMHPFALHKTLVRSAAASTGKLTGSLTHLFAAELALKSTGGSPRAILESVVLRICRPPKTGPEAQS
jgi:DNA polymerase-3 subunit delta